MPGSAANTQETTGLPTPYYDDGRGIVIYCGDALEVLKTLPDGFVQCCITSPPYWGLRDYGVQGQIGLESSPEEYVTEMVAVFREVRRVLRDDATLWLNMGDSYRGGGNYRGMNEDTLSAKQASNRGATGQLAIGRNTAPPALRIEGLKPKDLVGIPWRVAFALQADGWYLRQDIIWHKPNPMPESVTDRCTKAHEYVFLMSKNERYYYDQEAIKDPLAESTLPRLKYKRTPATKWYNADTNESDMRSTCGARANPNGRNRRSVWTVPTSPFPEAHFATFPPDLIKPMVMAGTPEKCCGVCGAPWEREIEVTQERVGSGALGNRRGDARRTQENGIIDREDVPQFRTAKHVKTLGFYATCGHGDDTGRSIVLDPFMGAGTTALVAKELGRRCVGIELKPEYITMAKKRLRQEVLL